MYEALHPVLIQFLVIVVGSMATYLSAIITGYIKKKNILSQIESKKKYAEIAVNAIQQVYKEAEGDKKLKAAQESLIEILNQNGIKFTESELDLIIESAVKGMKQGISENV